MSAIHFDSVYSNNNLSYEDQVEDLLWVIVKNWGKLSLKEKEQWIWEAKLALDASCASKSNEIRSRSYDTEHNGNYYQNFKTLSNNQSILTGFNAELGWDFLKNKGDFWKLKYFIWLPTLNSKDRTFIASKILANNGVIKANLNDVDYVIVSEGVFKGEENDMIKEQTKLFNYINQKHKDDDEKYINDWINKNIAFIHESTFKSRIAKLVTHAPKKT